MTSIGATLGTSAMASAGKYSHNGTNTSSLSNASDSPCINVGDYSSYSMFEFVVHLYIITLLCLVGLFGNIVSIIVIRKDTERRRPLFLLQALAIADSFYLFVCLGRYPLKYLMMKSKAYMYMQLVVYPLWGTAQTVTIWMMVLVTVDRYIYVCMPLRAHQIFSPRGRKILVGVVFGAAIIYCIPQWFEKEVFIFSVCDKVIAQIVYTEQMNKEAHMIIYHYIARLLFLYTIPFGILLVLNGKLISVIRRSRKKHRVLSGGHDHSEANATLVLIIIILVFLVCETPQIIIHYVSFINYFKKFMPEFAPSFQNFHTVTDLLLVINSSVNFFIYVIFGKRFRFYMKETFKYRPYASSVVTHETAPLHQLQQG